MADTLIRVRDLHKRFGELHVLRGVTLDVHRGERIAIVGSSGSGKSTLLRCINFMEVPTGGTIPLTLKIQPLEPPAGYRPIWSTYGPNEVVVTW